MNAGYYNGPPGSRPYDPEWDERHEPDMPLLMCRDCGAVIYVGGGTTGVASGASCEVDFQWRTAHGGLFDMRTRPQIEAAGQKGAA